METFKNFRRKERNTEVSTVVVLVIVRTLIRPGQQQMLDQCLNPLNERCVVFFIHHWGVILTRPQGSTKFWY